MEGWHLLAQTVPDAALQWLDPFAAVDPEALRLLVAADVVWLLSQGCALTLWALLRPMGWRLSGRRRVVPVAWRGTWALGALGLLTIATPFVALVQLRLAGTYWLGWSWVSLGATLAWIAVRAWHIDLIWLAPTQRRVVVRRRDHQGSVVLQTWPIPSVLEQAPLVDALTQHFGRKEAVVRYLERARAACQ